MWFSWRSLRVEVGVESKVNFLIVLAMTVYCFAFPVQVHKFLFQRKMDREPLDDEAFRQRFGALTQNTDTSKLEALVFTFLFLVRRLAFAYTICHLDRTITI